MFQVFNVVKCSSWRSCCRRHRSFKRPMFKYCCWRNSDYLRPQFWHCPSNRPQNFKAVNWEHPIYLAVVFFVPQESVKSLTDQEGKRLQTLVEATIKEQKESNKVSHCHFPWYTLFAFLNFAWVIVSKCSWMMQSSREYFVIVVYAKFRR